ncbi:MAG: hypothetical protein QN187_08915 [Armatimonadota bacterium]|nr:hypothetical protein [Armatimonadota bacterium]MDR7518940.1 hypothetical protein [Armatimonadota bacterium]
MRYLALALLLIAAAGTVPDAALGQGYGGGGGGGEGPGGGAIPSPAAAGDLRAQLRTALTHAANAAASEVLRAAQSHLTHVVNCLEGQRGRNYVQTELNPCQGQGNGILVDLRAVRDGGAWMPVAETAADLALRGSKMGDLAAARAAARGVAALLGTINDHVR